MRHKLFSGIHFSAVVIRMYPVPHPLIFHRYTFSAVDSLSLSNLKYRAICNNEYDVAVISSTAACSGSN